MKGRLFRAAAWRKLSASAGVVEYRDPGSRRNVAPRFNVEVNARDVGRGEAAIVPCEVDNQFADARVVTNDPNAGAVVVDKG